MSVQFDLSVDNLTNLIHTYMYKYIQYLRESLIFYKPDGDMLSLIHNLNFGAEARGREIFTPVKTVTISITLLVSALFSGCNLQNPIALGHVSFEYSFPLLSSPAEDVDAHT